MQRLIKAHIKHAFPMFVFKNILGIMLREYTSHCLIHFTIEEHVDLSFVCAIRNAPGTSAITTSQFSIASMYAMINIDSVCTVRALASPLFAVFLCGHTSVQERPLISPVRFSFRNINARRASFFCCCIKFQACLGINITLS